jgi:hypothetical protein
MMEAQLQTIAMGGALSVLTGLPMLARFAVLTGFTVLACLAMGTAGLSMGCLKRKRRVPGDQYSGGHRADF